MAGNDKRPLPKSQSELIGQKDDQTVNRANEVRRDNDNISILVYMIMMEL